MSSYIVPTDPEDGRESGQRYDRTVRSRRRGRTSGRSLVRGSRRVWEGGRTRTGTTSGTCVMSDGIPNRGDMHLWRRDLSETFPRKLTRGHETRECPEGPSTPGGPDDTSSARPSRRVVRSRT